MSQIRASLQNTLAHWSDVIISGLPDLLAALVVVVIFYGLAKLTTHLTRRSFRYSDAPASLQQLIARVSGTITFVIGVIIALNVLGLRRTVTTALAGAGVIGIALGFAFQDIAANFISGVFLVFRKPFTVGDIITIGDHTGAVEEINLRATKLHALDGRMIYIPNRKVFSGDITNYSELGTRRVEVACGVSYEDDLEYATKIAVNAIENLDVARADKPVEVYFGEFGDSSINFTLRFWVDFGAQTDFLQARDKAIKTVQTRFAEEGIDIPFPIRDVRLRDNARDGE